LPHSNDKSADLGTILPDGRVRDALARFTRHGPNGLALTGSIALAAQWARLRGERLDRAISDIDFVAASLDTLPASLADDFICPHVHGNAEPGRILAQLVHPGDAVRIDIFRPVGQAVSRATVFRMESSAIAVLSIEDQAARATSLCMKVTRGGAVVAKHVPDFVRLRAVLTPNRIDAVWQEYRREFEPPRFLDAVEQIDAAVRAHPERLIAPEFNRNPDAACPNCAAWGAFHPAEPAQTFRVLGYV
jgi:hypothetical protein